MPLLYLNALAPIFATVWRLWRDSGEGPRRVEPDNPRRKAKVAVMTNGRHDLRETILVYRDRIVPRSEAHFLRRQYLGFQHLAPIWIGCKTGDGLEDLGVQPLILGSRGVLGALDRALFKQLGVLPSRPDLKALRPCLVHAHFGRGGALALPIARALKIPLVVTYHGGDAAKEKHYRRRLVPTIYQRRLAALQREASIIICVSDWIRHRLVERGFPPEKLRVLRYGVEMGGPDPLTPAPQPPYVLFVGRFVEKKGITYLIQALRLLESQGMRVSLVLIGDGPLASSLQEEARTLSDIRFLGWLPEREVRYWMRGAIALCVPSVTSESGDAEGLPNVVLEAMAEGTPVIGSRHSGIAEAVEDERSGLLVPERDPHAIMESIRWLSGNPAARRAMCDRARHRAEECFNAVRQSRHLEELLLSVVEARRGEEKMTRSIEDQLSEDQLSAELEGRDAEDIRAAAKTLLLLGRLVKLARTVNGTSAGRGMAARHQALATAQARRGVEWLSELIDAIDKEASSAEREKKER